MIDILMLKVRTACGIIDDASVYTLVASEDTKPALEDWRFPSDYRTSRRFVAQLESA